MTVPAAPGEDGPRPAAANTVVPMIAARTTEIGKPLVAAYIQIAASGTRK